MQANFHEVILSSTGARAILSQEQIQDLWSGYGKILRLDLEGAELPSIIIKQIQLQEKTSHPRGWHGAVGHQRKLKSYQVESHWYQHYAKQSKARLPQCFATEKRGSEMLLVLEDLDAAGYPLRASHLNWEQMKACIQWLAAFHATYMDTKPEGLWETGTYWHLETRPQELEALQDKALKEAAPLIDARLKSAQYQCLVHGDAKLANFCFAKDGRVAAVDFQYVGGGCGMKDLAYFVGSCLMEEDCEALESRILDHYFECLHQALGRPNADLEAEWRALYPVAWADFHRFLKGWSPGHWKINSYSERITQQVIASL